MANAVARQSLNDMLNKTAHCPLCSTNLRRTDLQFGPFRCPKYHGSLSIPKSYWRIQIALGFVVSLALGLICRPDDTYLILLTLVLSFPAYAILTHFVQYIVSPKITCYVDEHSLGLR